jgi:rhodanese-related sulfurtransferase
MLAASILREIDFLHEVALDGGMNAGLEGGSA